MEILNKFQMELQGKNDKSFIDSIYKLMRDMLNYKPPLTKEQFFSIGYAEIKALMACEIISLIQQKFKLNVVSTRQPQQQQPTLLVPPQIKANENQTGRVGATNTRATTLGVPGNLAPNRVIVFSRNTFH